jgi:hypothetical protein
VSTHSLKTLSSNNNNKGKGRAVEQSDHQSGDGNWLRPDRLSSETQRSAAERRRASWEGSEYSDDDVAPGDQEEQHMGDGGDDDQTPGDRRRRRAKGRKNRIQFLPVTQEDDAFVSFVPVPVTVFPRNLLIINCPLFPLARYIFR